MSNKATKTRVANAFKAMKGLGISQDKVKPVLKNLLTLYDKDWTLIEEENYRALADAIFEREESEAAKQSKKLMDTQADPFDRESLTDQELERPLKRLRRKPQVDQTSCSTASGIPKTQLIRPKEEKDVLPELALVPLVRSQNIMHSTQIHGESYKEKLVDVTSSSRGNRKQAVSPKALTQVENHDACQPDGLIRDQQDSVVDSRSPSHPLRYRERGKECAPSQVRSSEKGPEHENSSLTVCLRQPKAEPVNCSSPEEMNAGGLVLIKPKEEPIFDISVSAPIIYPNKSNGGDPSKGNINHGETCTQETLELLPANGKEVFGGTVSQNEPGDDGRMSKNPDGHSTCLEVASSPSGEVKMLLRLDLAPQRNTFPMPNLQTVLNSVQDKCLRSNINNSVSLSNVLTEICQCFLEFRTNCNGCSPLDVDQTKETANNTSEGDGRLSTGLGFNALNGSKDPLCGNELCQQLCEGLNDVIEPSNMDIDDEMVKDGKKSDVGRRVPIEVVMKTQGTSEVIQTLDSVFDIAKGKEKIVITVVNEVNDELPPDFCYITQNAVFKNACVDFSLVQIRENNYCSSCSVDCLSSPSLCACARESGGELLYMSDGLLKEALLRESVCMNQDPKKHCQFFCKECPLERAKCEDPMEPCRGHLARKFIKECWLKCGCSNQCGNRVVQRGITRNLQVFMTSEGKGWGLRALEDLPKGTFVCEYIGEILTNAELLYRVIRLRNRMKPSYTVLLDAGWSTDRVLNNKEALCLDATYYGNVARFINHRCYDSNLVEIPVEVDSPDHRYYHLAFFTTREVKAMEELTWDYGIDFDDCDYPFKAFECQCGSKFCRNIKRTRCSWRSLL